MLSLRGVWTIRPLRGPEAKVGGAGEVMRIASLLFWLDRHYRWESFLFSIIEHVKERFAGWGAGGAGEGLMLKSQQLLSTSVCTTLSDWLSP